MQKNAEIALLLDCYQSLITPRQADVLNLYYEEDLSLAEITEHYGVTRQAVLDLVRRGEKQLYHYEACLGLGKGRLRKAALAEQIRAEAELCPSPQKERLRSLAEDAETL